MIFKNPTSSLSNVLFICILLLSIITLLPSCGLIGKADKPPAAEDFDLFYLRFHNDPDFQLSRIDFPLEGGLVQSHGEELWTPENWPIMKVPVWDINDPEYSVDYKQTEVEFIQRIWIENSGFISEYRFRLIDGKWMLVYALEQNL
ncbi:MAG: DUF4348 domain-containing protein [Saprospirales bacterium]|nr:MAG: DUF4348 domain-containing protein [Saprospirales bacterium]